MLEVLLSWIYILIVTYLLGFAFKLFIQWLTKNKLNLSFDIVIIAGFVMATVYASYFSIFHGVGRLTNVILVLICGIIFVSFYKKIKDDLIEAIKKLRYPKILLFFLLAVLFASATSAGVFHYDTSLYHAQAIHWIEQFGLVKGLGNLHHRFAYNSSYLISNALFSLKFIFGRSLHTLSGLIMLLVTTYAFTSFRFIKEKVGKIYISDLVKIAALVYVVICFGLAISPESDLPAMLLVFYIIIKWLEGIEAKNNDPNYYSILSILLLYLVTVKLSTAFLLILAIKPAFLLLKKQNYKLIAIYIFLGFIIISPYLIRNILISGYLVYPVTKIDVFNVDWKMPKTIVEVDSQEIQVWGRGVNDVALFNQPTNIWLPKWFSSQIISDQLILILNLAAIPIGLAMALFLRAKKWVGEYLWVWLAVAASVVFWLLSAPLIRYGLAFLLLLPALTIGILIKLTNFKLSRVLYVVLFLVFLLWLQLNGTYIISNIKSPYLIQQIDYPNFPATPFPLGKETIYIPVNGDQVGYSAFPASLGYTNKTSYLKVELRGNGFSEGFRYKK